MVRSLQKNSTQCLLYKISRRSDLARPLRKILVRGLLARLGKRSPQRIYVRYLPFKLVPGNLFKRNLCHYQLLPLTKKQNVRYLPLKLVLRNLFNRNPCYYQLLPLTKKENVRYLPFKLLLGDLFKRNLCYYQLLSLKEGERKVPPFQVACKEPLQKKPLLLPAATSTPDKDGERKVPTFQVSSGEHLQKEPPLLSGC